MENKSAICLEQKSGRKAYTIAYNKLTKKTEKYKTCPKSCTYMGITLGSKSTNAQVGSGRIVLKLEQYIQVSISSFTYCWLELLAEVGGYFGLFLGVSVNQIVSLSKHLFITVEKYA